MHALSPLPSSLHLGEQAACSSIQFLDLCLPASKRQSVTLCSPCSRLGRVCMNTPGPCPTVSIGHADVGTSRFSQPLPGPVPSNPVQSSPPSSARMKPPHSHSQGPPLSNVIPYPPSISQFSHGSASLDYLLEAYKSARPCVANKSTRGYGD
jgi:hypothetical protein